MLVVHMPSNVHRIASNLEEYLVFVRFSNHNELLSVSTHSILLPTQNVANPLQASMTSTWQIVSLDYSDWIDSVAYADLDGIHQYE
jgi:hypothetical protein